MRSDGAIMFTKQQQPRQQAEHESLQLSRRVPDAEFDPAVQRLRAMTSQHNDPIYVSSVCSAVIQERQLCTLMGRVLGLILLPEFTPAVNYNIIVSAFFLKSHMYIKILISAYE